jgi:hypothetical protein
VNVAECDACQAFMLWAITPNGGKMPVDYRPSPQGNVLLLSPSGLGELLAITLSKEGLELARARGLDLRMPHHATCPEAERFRRR